MSISTGCKMLLGALLLGSLALAVLVAALFGWAMIRLGVGDPDPEHVRATP